MAENEIIKLLSFQYCVEFNFEVATSICFIPILDAIINNCFIRTGIVKKKCVCLCVSSNYIKQVESEQI